MTDIDPRVAASFSKQGLMSLLGATLLEAGEGRCRVRADYAPSLTQQHGLWHGAVSAALADAAAGFAGFSLMDSDRQPLSVEYKINFLSPARGAHLEARAEVVRNGYRVKHVHAEVFAIDGPSETKVAIVLATIASTRSVSEIDDPPPALSE